MTLSFAMGIREGRCSNQVAGVGALVPGDETFTDAGVDGAVRGRGLVRKAGEILLDEAFFEIFARVPGDDFLAHLRRKLIEPHSQHIEKNTRIEERHFGAHVLRDAGGGVQRDCFPDGLHLIFSNVVGVEELPGGICAIDLEAFVLARELLDQTEIVKCGGHVEEFRVEAQFSLTTLLSREQVDADRVIEEQIGGMLAQDVCGLFREQGIGNDEGIGEIWLVIVASFQGQLWAWRRIRLASATGGLIDQLAPTASTIFPFG